MALLPLYSQIKLRGGVEDSDSVDSDSGPIKPHGPRILEDRRLVGSDRVVISRLILAPEKEGGMDMDVETLSNASKGPSPTDYEAEEEEVADPRPDPSRPLRRARGRPRRDGSGPFRETTSTAEEV